MNLTLWGMFLAPTGTSSLLAREGAGCGSMGDVPGAWLASARSSEASGTGARAGTEAEEAAGRPGRRKVAFCQTPGAALALGGLAKDRDPGGIIMVADYPSQAEVLYALVLIP